jgi:integrase
LAGSDSFRDLLLITWETAARPQESLIVEARHVDLKNSRWHFRADEAKGEKWPRIVYLTDTALEITRRLMREYPTRPLFRNTDGRPWTTDAVNCAFSRIQYKMGKKQVEKAGLILPPIPRFQKSKLTGLVQTEQNLLL